MNDIPEMQVECTFGPNGAAFTIDDNLYPLDAIYGAAYLFIDRCYIYLSRPSEGKVEVHLKVKPDQSPIRNEDLSGEFCNELLNQTLRVRIGESTAKIREYYMARAFVSHPAQASIDALLAELDAEELEDDDLEISVPWEDDDE